MLDFFLKWSGIKESIVSIFLFLDAIVYSFISYVYQIFLVLAGTNNIVDDSFIDGFVDRLYLIIGVVALFIIAYSLLKVMINPDEGLKSKNSPTKFIFNIITSIVLVALIPTIFNFAYAVQNSLLAQNTIGKLILGPTTTSYNGTNMDTNTVISQGGYLMASSVFQAFLHPSASSPDYCQTVDEEANADEVGCQILMVDDNDWGLLNFLHGIPLVNTAANIIDEVVIENLMLLFTGSRGGTSYGTVQKTSEYNQSFFTYGIYSNAIVEGTVSYYPVVSTVVGIYVLIILVIYVLATALRVVKLSVFELIAPIPILARIIPNDQVKKVFDNWLKATLSTFAEVFIRLALLFFAILMINTVVFSIDNLFSPIMNNWGSIRWDILFIAQALVVLGVIKFVKEAPQILKDITGLDSGKYGKAFIQGLGVMTASFGGGATAAIRSYTIDKKDGMGFKERLGRAVTAGASGGARGLWQGRKTEKIGDIPKAAGTAASNALSARGRREAAGGWMPYIAQRYNDSKERVKDWMGGSAEELKELKKINDNILKQVDGIKSLAQDYIDKHAYEYFNNEELQANFDNLNLELKQAEERGDLAEQERLKVLIDNFKEEHAANRLDVLKSKYEWAKTHGSPEELAAAESAYNKSRKDLVDGFASTSKNHVGAEKEAAQVKEFVKTLDEMIKEYRSTPAVKYAIGLETHANVKSTFTEADLQNNTAKFIKNFSDAAQYSNIDIQSQIADIERREERRKASSGGKDKK